MSPFTREKWRNINVPNVSKCQLNLEAIGDAKQITKFGATTNQAWVYRCTHQHMHTGCSDWFDLKIWPSKNRGRSVHKQWMATCLGTITTQANPELLCELEVGDSHPPTITGCDRALHEWIQHFNHQTEHCDCLSHLQSTSTRYHGCLPLKQGPVCVSSHNAVNKIGFV